jgi:hypothetical protein
MKSVQGRKKKPRAKRTGVYRVPAYEAYCSRCRDYPGVVESRRVDAERHLKEHDCRGIR